MAATLARVMQQLNEVTLHLMTVGLANDQNFAARRDGRGGAAISVSGTGWAEYWKVPYEDAYFRMLSERNFNALLLDGALLQLSYRYARNGALTHHRLAFFPSPDLETFGMAPDDYLADAPYLDIVARRVAPMPIRFDFDSAAATPVVHPASHLSLGEYADCRIPVSHPLTPIAFVRFILSSFYAAARGAWEPGFPSGSHSFATCLHTDEAGALHIAVPE